MKISMRILAATVAALAILAAQAGAQSQVARARIPFEFNANGTALPPGVYDVSQIGSTGSVLVLRGRSNGVAFMVATARSKTAEASRLVFHRYGDAYFLREVWFGGGRRIGYAVPESKAERAHKNGDRRGNAQVVHVAVTLG